MCKQSVATPRTYADILSNVKGLKNNIWVEFVGQQKH